MPRLYQARQDLLTNDLGTDELVMLNTESGNFFGVVNSSRAVWDALSEPVSKTDLCELLRSNYDVGSADIDTDVSRFLERLLASQLIEVVS